MSMTDASETDGSETFGEYIQQGFDGDAHKSRAERSDAAKRAASKHISDPHLNTLEHGTTSIPPILALSYPTTRKVESAQDLKDPLISPMEAQLLTGSNEEKYETLAISRTETPKENKNWITPRSFVTPFLSVGHPEPDSVSRSSQVAPQQVGNTGDYKSVTSLSQMRPRKWRESLVSFRNILGGSISVDGDQFRSINKRGFSILSLFFSLVLTITAPFIPWSSVSLLSDSIDKDIPGVGPAMDPHLKITLMDDFTNESCKISKVFIILFLSLSYVGILAAVHQFWKTVTKAGLVSAFCSFAMLLSCTFIWAFGCHKKLAFMLDHVLATGIGIDSGLYITAVGCLFCMVSFFIRLYDYCIGLDEKIVRTDHHGREKCPLNSSSQSARSESRTTNTHVTQKSV